MLHAIIMAGGGGTRFWPRSRMQQPKQFLALGGPHTLLQQAAERAQSLVPPDRIWVVTGDAYREETWRELPDVPRDHIVGEPVGRDTAPCVGLGASLVVREDPDALTLVMSADHVIEPVEEFRRAAQTAEQVVRDNPSALVTFGVAPTFAATGYGYIHVGESLGARQGVGVYRVQKFCEKPTRDIAEQFVASGHYFWNSGIFVWHAQTILQALRRNAPGIFEAVGRVADAWKGADRDAVFRQEYSALPKISIDYAVMEKAPEVLVLQAPFHWDDVGSWLSVERMNPQDAEGNTVLGSHCGLRTRRCVIVSDRGHLVATLGVEDLLVVQAGNATLVARRQDEGAMKQLVERLRASGFGEYL